MTRPVIDCPKYEPVSGSRRCEHFLSNGGCSREDTFMCEPWVRANGHLVRSGDSTVEAAGPAARLAPSQACELRAIAPVDRSASAAPPYAGKHDSSGPKLSYSRVSLWEQCPLAYRFRYHDRLETTESKQAAELGSAVHAAIEEMQREHLREERRGPISRESATYHWRQAFTEARLSGADVFAEGLGLVLGFVRDQGPLDAYDVLAIEEPFELKVGKHTVIGVIDRVDRIGEETIEIIDFKTSRLLFTRDELESNLQLSLYCIAAKQLWPWAKNIRLTMWMLRHNLRQEATRTPEQLEAAREYLQAIGDQIVAATEYPARPNTLCGYCDYRRSCPTYAKLLQGRHEVTADNLEDLEAVAREREQVAAVSKAAYRRQQELDAVLKAHLAERDELVLGGVRYATFRVTSNDYPLDATVEVLARVSGMPEADVRARIGTVENTKLESLLGKVAKQRGRAEAALVESELGALATQRHTQRIWAKPIKEVRT